VRRGRRRLTLRGLVLLRPTGFVRRPMVVSTAPRLIRRGSLLFLVVHKDRVFPDFDRLNLAVVDYVDRLDGRVSVRLARRWRGCATADTSASTLPF
jgi:hypothetical protein